MSQGIGSTRNAVLFFVVLILAVSNSGIIQAQNKGERPENMAVVAPGAIPIQGRLTNASGSPLTGTYNLTFRLYEGAASVTALCSDVRSVDVVNGLFSDVMDHCYGGIINGQKLWLGIQAGSDPEMTPRQVIYPVPYALALVPGAKLVSSATLPLSVETSNTSGTALEVKASSSTGANIGVSASSSSVDGIAGYFFNFGSGTGVQGLSVAGVGVDAGSLGTALRAHSGAGAAISAEGTGRITSSAKSYLWISGNGLRPYRQSDTTIIDMDTVGGAKISSGAVVSNKNVMLPITITGPLYGQNVTVTGLDIYWQGSTDFDGISAVLLRRQTGVCDTASCYLTILNNGTDRVCTATTDPTGCTEHFDLTTNNILSSNSGILYLTLEFGFGGTTGWVRIGGVRLTLEHD
jgi:hypothetical protein